MYANRVLQFVNDQSEWNAREKECANLPVKITTDFINGNNVLPISYILSVSLGVDLPRVEILSLDGRPTLYWKFIGQFQTCDRTKLAIEVSDYRIYCTSVRRSRGIK